MRLRVLAHSLLQLLPVLLLVLGVRLGLVWLQSRKGKGKVGEFLVGHLLAGLGPGYEVLNDLTFALDGETTQIDHVVVSTHGVFVVETKNFEGRIFGKPDDKNWTQMNGKFKRPFQNPVRQNWRHVRFLADKLGVNESTIVPMVVFLGGVEFPKGKPDGVHYPRELVKAILADKTSRLNNAHTATLSARLKDLGATTREKTSAHLENLKTRHARHSPRG